MLKKGVIEWVDGLNRPGKYTGEIDANGKAYGKGIYVAEKTNIISSTFRGTFVNNKANGFVHVTYEHGGMDFGEIQDDKFHGKATAKYSNGDIFNEERDKGVLEERIKVDEDNDEEHWFPVNKPQVILI